MIDGRIAALRREMKKRRIAVYVVPSSDYHNSEYVGDYFKAREYITGFTGSAGTAVITLTDAGLWTDARYFLQAAHQLRNTDITLYRMGEDKVPGINDYIEKNLKKGENIGFDGRLVNAVRGEELAKIARKKHGTVCMDEDLIGLIWEDRPPLSAGSAWIHDIKYTGMGALQKIDKVRRMMEEEGANVHLISSLTDIAWLLNIRGNDIPYVPVTLSYFSLSREACIWFVQEQAFSQEVLAYLHMNDIEVRPYESFWDYVKTLENKRILLNKKVVSYRICKSIPGSAKIIDRPDPSEMFKAVKTPVEIYNSKIAHRKDGVAMCRLMYWLKTNVGKIPMTEISVSNYLSSLREEQEGFLDHSFETICGYAEHGAIVHYSATPETDAVIEPEGLLLVDSGAHYREGTTDVTRTFVLGPITEEMKTNFTRVCRANLNLANAFFLKGISTGSLDVIAREPLWEAKLDYKHGTGHGVGHLLSVHEGPNRFHWKAADCELKTGMITTDEPGLYLEGKYGIRLENELVCCEDQRNEYGQFLCFENITYVPIDLDGIDPEQMSVVERLRLNDYHRKVYHEISPYLEAEELEWLADATREI